LSIPMVAYDFGVGQFFSGAMGQLYPGGDTLSLKQEYIYQVRHKMVRTCIVAVQQEKGSFQSSKELF